MESSTKKLRYSPYKYRRCTYHSCQCCMVYHQRLNRPMARSMCPLDPYRTVRMHRDDRNTVAIHTVCHGTSHYYIWHTAELGNWADLQGKDPYCMFCIESVRQYKMIHRIQELDDHIVGFASTHRHRIHVNTLPSRSNRPSRHRQVPVALQSECISVNWE